ncbi:MAG: HAD family hydrolase [Candidatus Zambryskibacteria bacterium]|nr:HAD family hydrolase [Candidatus Zambryskibacteria bacterium]
MSDTNFKKIKVIGFDLDQTLYPKSPKIDKAIQEYICGKIAKKFNTDIDTAANKFRELYHMQGLGGTTSLIRLGFPPEEASNAVQEALENADIAQFLKPNQELIDLLNKLGSKYSLDVITGSNQKNTKTKLVHLNIPLTLFNNIITSDDGSKSLGTSYKLWLFKYPDFTPEEFLYIGDRPRSDYEVPTGLGINCILVNMEESDNFYKCRQLKSILGIASIL